MFLLSSKLTFQKKSFWNTIRVSNGLNLDQDRCLSADEKSNRWQQKIKFCHAGAGYIKF